MNAQEKPQMIDIIVTIVLFLVALAGLLQTLNFPGRAGMWPTFVIVALILFVGLHLLNLLKAVRKARVNES